MWNSIPHFHSVFWCTKLRHFHKVLLSVFYFVAFCVLFQEIIARCNVVKFCPVFSCKSIIVLGLTFRSLIHLEFVFVNGFRKGSNFNLLNVDIQFPQNRWLKWLPFSHSVMLAQFLKISWTDFQIWRFTSELSILSQWSICLSWCQYHAILITVAL